MKQKDIVLFVEKLLSLVNRITGGAELMNSMETGIITATGIMKYKTNKDLKKHYKIKVDNKMRYFGDTDLAKREIRINKKKSRKSGRKGEVLDTIVHEAMHAKHPKMHENTVKRKTKALIPNLSIRHKRSYYNLARG